MADLLPRLRVVRTITAKDLRLRFRDRSVVLIAFVVPIGLALLFDLLFGGLAEGSLGRIALGVADLDGGPAGTAFTQRYLPEVIGFLDDEGTELDPVVLASAADAEAGVEDGSVDAAIVLPPGMSAALAAAEPFQVQVLTHADRSLVGEMVESVADLFVQQARGQLAARLLAERLQLTPEQAAAFADAATGVQGRVTLDQAPAGVRQLDPSTYLAAGMAIFFLLFSVQFGVLGYLEERRDGTLPRLLASPIARWQVMAAKALTSLLIGLASVAMLMLVSIPLLGASWGDPLAVVALVVAAVLAATGIVAAVASVARTAEQANVWSSIIAVVLGMLGGSFFPVAGGPGWLERLSLLTPHAWFLRGLGTLADPSSDIGEVLLPIGALLTFGVAVTLVAAGLSRRLALR